MKNHTVPPGVYYLGDPCYCFKEGWGEVLDNSEVLEEPFEKDGRKLVAFGTAYGDGAYFDKEFRRYLVDAGLIGLTPIEFIEDKDQILTYLARDNGVMVELLKETECHTKDGILTFGDIVIDTDSSGEDEDED